MQQVKVMQKNENKGAGWPLDIDGGDLDSSDSDGGLSVICESAFDADRRYLEVGEMVYPFYWSKHLWRAERMAELPRLEQRREQVAIATFIAEPHTPPVEELKADEWYRIYWWGKIAVPIERIQKVGPSVMVKVSPPLINAFADLAFQGKPSEGPSLRSIMIDPRFIERVAK
jgi:hypothetical protein